MKFNLRNLFVASIAGLLSFPAGAADTRGFTAGRYAIDIGGVSAGWVQSVEGGGATADVVEQKPDPVSGFAKKHIGNLRYEQITLQLGFSNGPNIYDWIAASWKRNFQRKNGSVVLADFHFVAKRRVDFSEALITETTIPACDASDRDPAFLTVKLTPESTRAVAPGGKLPPPPPSRAWRPANFRLLIDGLDTSRVNKIDSFTVKQQIIENPVGQERDFGKEPGKLEFPNLTITFAESSAQSWLDWLDDFVVKGNSGDDKERSGTLEFLSPNQGTVLARIRFFNMGIVSVGPAKAVPNPCNNGCPADPDDVRDAIGKMQAVLYVERMEFEAAGMPQ
jgi:phage tail-like protein